MEPQKAGTRLLPARPLWQSIFPTRLKQNCFSGHALRVSEDDVYGMAPDFSGNPGNLNSGSWLRDETPGKPVRTPQESGAWGVASGI
jgi:hypothetical protein